MSLSNPTPTNPAKRFFTWKGSTGKLVYWDKENSKQVEAKQPFSFIVLDELSTVAGFCEPDKSSFWSNEIRNIGKEELTVRTSKGTKAVGIYRDIADEIKSKGAKYARSIYLAYKDEDGFVMGNFKASGAASGAWMDFGQKYVVQNGKITITGSTEEKKGATTYFVPTFKYSSYDTDEFDIAVELDKELQVYLSQYFAASHVDPVPEEEPTEELNSSEQVRRDNPKLFHKDAPDSVANVDPEEAINLDDIPF